MKYLQVDSEGNIESYSEVVEGFSLQVPEGSISVESNTTVNLETMYWDLNTSTLTLRPAKPSPFYRWENKQWTLDSVYLISEIRTKRSNLLKQSGS